MTQTPVRALALLAALPALLLMPSLAVADDLQVTVAVSYFDNTSGNEQLDALRKGFADMLIADLSVSNEIRLVEREHLQQLVGEMKLQKNPYFDRTSAARMGRGLGAAFILTGSYLVRKDTLRLDVRVVDVETATVAFSANEEGPVDDIFDIERRLARKLLDGLGAKLSLIQRKRIGAKSTRDFTALRHYADSLDARDRGDGAAERKALAEALARDPSFGQVKTRMAALEKKIAVLEKGGGRIVDPREAREFLHNARIQKAEGDYRGALASLRQAATRKPELIDIWLLVGAINARNQMDVHKLPVASGLRKIVVSYLAGEVETLHKQLTTGDKRYRTHAAAFLFDVQASQLPTSTLQPYVRMHDAVRQLEAARKGGALAPLFVDYLPLWQRVTEVKQRYFHANGVRQVEVLGASFMENQDQLKIASPWWFFQPVFLERPRGPITVTIERDLGHPHWQEKAGPVSAHQLRLPPHLSDRARIAEIERALADPKNIPYGVLKPPDYHAKVRWQFARLGTPISIPESHLLCQQDKLMLTGHRCSAYVRMFKRRIPPGYYRATLRYRDQNGHPMVAKPRLLVFEFEEIESRPPHELNQRRGPKAVVHRLDGAYRKQWPAVVKGLAKSLVSKRTFKVENTIFISNYYRHRATRWGKRPAQVDVASWHFDLDYQLVGGQPIASDDVQAWLRYRKRILKDGYQVKAWKWGFQHLPLPKLSSGRHSLCIVSKRTNGSLNAEPECLSIVVP